MTHVRISLPLSSYGARLLLVLAAFIFASAWAGANETCKLTVSTLKPDAVYATGETVTFIVGLSHNGKVPEQAVQVEWVISKDGLPPRTSGTHMLDNGQLQLTGVLDEPGFLQCEVRIAAGNAPCGNDKPIVALAAAAVSAEQIRPSVAAPADFDAYWSAQLAALRATPPVVKLVRVGAGDPKYAGLEVYDLQASAPGGVQVSGYLAFPEKARARSLPALLTVHGAGVRSSNLDGAAKWARQGMIVLDINAHGIANGQPKEFYDNLSATSLKNYSSWSSGSREDSYFRMMFLRVISAIDILCERREWNGKTLITYGSSQGGAQALVGAALDKRVTQVISGVPAMCDHSAMLAGRQAGWPRFVRSGAGGGPDAEALEAAGYYDMVNFAARTHAPAVFTVGFVDRVCPPTSVYAAYNNLAGDKVIFNDLLAGHTNTREALDFMAQSLLEHIKAGAGR